MSSDCLPLFADILCKIGFKDFHVDSLKCLNSDMLSFIEWLVYNTSDENYITEEEFYLYNDLKREVSLDSECEVECEAVICSFGSSQKLTEEVSFMLSIDDMKCNLEFVKKKVQNLKYLEPILRKEKRRNTECSFSSEALLKKELDDIDVINNAFNEGLAFFAQAWGQLSDQVSCEYKGPRINEETVSLLETYLATDKELENKISDELRQLSEEGSPAVTSVLSTLDFKLICNMLVNVDNELFRKRTELECNKVAADCFQQLLNKICGKTNQPSLQEIRELLANLWEERGGLVVERLAEVDRELRRTDRLAEAQLEAARGTAAHLQSCLARLVWAEDLLQRRAIIHETVVYLLKRERVLFQGQLYLLEECSHRMTTFTAMFQQRMRERQLDGAVTGRAREMNPGCLGMMDLLGRNTDLRGLNTELALLRTSASSLEDHLVSSILVFMTSNMAICDQIKRTNTEVLEGPTRDICTTIFSNYKKILKDLSNSVSQEETTFKDFLKKFKKGAKKECYWLNCMKDPRYFIESLVKNCDRVNKLSQKNKQRFS